MTRMTFDSTMKYPGESERGAVRHDPFQQCALPAQPAPHKSGPVPRCSSEIWCLAVLHTATEEHVEQMNDECSSAIERALRTQVIFSICKPVGTATGVCAKLDVEGQVAVTEQWRWFLESPPAGLKTKLGPS